MSDSRVRSLEERITEIQRTIAAALYLLASGDAKSAAKARRLLAQLVPELYEEPGDEEEDD